MNKNYVILFFMLISISFTYAAVTANCAYGYNGDKCDECGLVNYAQNVRIVGGMQAVAYSWPSIVYLYFSYTRSVNIGGGRTATYTFNSACGGTIIDRKTILTAGHCIVNTVDYTDIYGNGQTAPVVTNNYNPTIGSMYSVYVGLQDKSNLNNLQYPAVKMSVNKVIRVSLLLFVWFYFIQKKT